MQETPAKYKKGPEYIARTKRSSSIKRCKTTQKSITITKQKKKYHFLDHIRIKNVQQKEDEITDNLKEIHIRIMNFDSSQNPDYCRNKTVREFIGIITTPNRNTDDRNWDTSKSCKKFTMSLMVQKQLTRLTNMSSLSVF